MLRSVKRPGLRTPRYNTATARKIRKSEKGTAGGNEEGVRRERKKGSREKKGERKREPVAVWPGIVFRSRSRLDPRELNPYATACIHASTTAGCSATSETV